MVCLSVCLSVCLLACLSVCHIRVLCSNGRTYRQDFFCVMSWAMSPYAKLLWPFGDNWSSAANNQNKPYHQKMTFGTTQQQYMTIQNIWHLLNSSVTILTLWQMVDIWRLSHSFFISTHISSLSVISPYTSHRSHIRRANHCAIISLSTDSCLTWSMIWWSCCHIRQWQTNWNYPSKYLSSTLRII